MEEETIDYVIRTTYYNPNIDDDTVDNENQETTQQSIYRAHPNEVAKVKRRVPTDEPVECWDAQGQILCRSFTSVKEAVNLLRYPHAKFIVDCMRGYRPKAYEFCWRPIETNPGSSDTQPLSIKVDIEYN
jgi:hypothetical protein